MRAVIWILGVLVLCAMVSVAWSLPNRFLPFLGAGLALVGLNALYLHLHRNKQPK